MSVSIDAEKRRQTWRENGASSQGVNGLGENGAKWVRVGAVDTGLAFDRPKYKEETMGGNVNSLIHINTNVLM
jgi:hypothetical protein